MADRKLAGTVTVEVATLADEFVWLLDDTAVLCCRPRSCRDRTLYREPAAALRGCTGALQPRPRIFVGSPRSPGRRRLPQVARRARVLRLLRREHLPHRHGGRARRPRLAARPLRTRRRKRTICGPRVRRPPLVLGSQRHVGFKSGDHVGMRRRRRNRALRSQLPQVDRAGLGHHRRDSRLPQSHPQSLRDHRADSSREARARGDREDDREQPAGQGRLEHAPGIRGAHELHI